MKKYYFIITLLLVILAAPAALRADTTYYLLAQDIQQGSISGTITTNGNLGPLGTIEIDSFSFGVTNVGSSNGNGGASGREQGKTPSVSEIGSGLTATSSGLFFDFDNPQPSALIFRDALDGFEWCIFTDEGCDPAGSGESLSLGGSSDVVTGLSGDVMIASIAPTPEPGIFGLVLIGIVSLVLVMRKQLLSRDPSPS